MLDENPEHETKLRDVLEFFLCKICKQNEVTHVNLPCSHLVTCLDCTTTQDLCIICRKKLTGSLKVYIS